MNLFAFLLLAGSLQAAPPLRGKKIAQLHTAHYENVLGTSFEIKTAAYSDKQSEVAEQAALKEIARLSSILSAYDANSEFSRWMKTKNEKVKVSPELFTVLALFDEWRTKTGGALDASAETINTLWKAAAAKSTMPSKEDLAAAVANVQQAHWALDAQSQTAAHLSDAPLKLNSFTKSFIIRSAADAALKASNAPGVIVNIGGDMVISGDVREPVMISNPKADAENDAPIDQLLISDKAVATSGNYRRGEMINGKWYSHIVDPRTAMPANDILSATVVANSATEAGALATAFNVMKPEESIALAEKTGNVDYLIITRDGRRIESANWKSLQIPGSTVSSKNLIAAAEKDWKNELVINLELAQHQGYAKRPFAAVWVEDIDQHIVKTIALWYNKQRWLPDLRTWFRKNRETMMGDPSLFGSVTSATRSPGKYTLKWDGKDDKGNTLKSGKYTLFIEVAREHGGYDLLKQEVDCGNASKQYQLQGEAEVAGALIDYKSKSNDHGGDGN
jgi:thiamine biosynthesis lipoprotein ApbE